MTPINLEIGDTIFVTMTEQDHHGIVSKVINFHYFIPNYGYVVSLRSSLAVIDRLVLLVLNQLQFVAKHTFYQIEGQSAGKRTF